MAKKLIIDLQQAAIKALEAATEAGNEAILDLQANLLTRVFVKGKDATETPIGKYSTVPMYATKRPQVNNSRIKPRGKNAVKGQKSQAVFQNGNPRKSMYLPGGYSEYRKLVGRQNNHVDLNLTGNLLGDIRVGSTANGNVLAFTTDEQSQLGSALETKYNKTIFAASDLEISKMDQIVEAAMDKAFFNSLDS